MSGAVMIAVISDALIEVAWRASLLLPLAWLLAYVARGNSATLKRSVWAVAHCAMAVLTLALAVAAARTALSVSSPVPQHFTMGPIATMVSLVIPARTPTNAPWRVWLVALWSGGVLFAGLRIAIKSAAARRMLRSATPLMHTERLALVASVAERLGIRQPVRVVHTEAIATAAVCGLFRPTLLLAHNCDDWSDERFRLVVTHELTHVANADLPLLIVAHGVSLLHWFNPAVWWALSALRHQQEFACDERVLTLGERADSYAETLLDLAVEARGRPALSLGATGAPLDDRIVAILEERPRIRSATAWRALVVAAMLTGTVMAWRLPLGTSSLLRPSNASDISEMMRTMSPGQRIDVFPDRLGRPHATIRAPGQPVPAVPSY